jgi:hypothetical protein
MAEALAAAVASTAVVVAAAASTAAVAVDTAVAVAVAVDTGNSPHWSKGTAGEIASRFLFDRAKQPR